MRGNNRQEYSQKYILIILLSIILLSAFSGVIHLKTPSAVVELVVMEAGEEILIDDFLKDRNKKAEFITDIKSLDTCVVGKHDIKIRVGSKTYETVLEVIDSKPPSIIATDQWALRGEELDPNAFISEISDATPVNIFFESTPDTSIQGEQEVTIICEDGGMNRTVGKAKLTVLDIQSMITVEAGSEINITPEAFMKDSRDRVLIVTNLENLDISKPSVHQIELAVNGKIITGSIKVVDTTPPEAVVRAQQIWMGEEINAEAFFEHISDVTKVVSDYKSPIDFNKPGEQEVTLILTDEAGNRAEFSTVLSVIQDKEPPVLSGISNKLVYIGDSISYRKGVSVADNKDKELDFEVDSSRVNLKREGTYEVYYSAVDDSGNKAIEKIEVKVEKYVVTEDMVYELCDTILADIIESSMTRREMAYEIFKWTRNHLNYTGDSDKSDWLAEAYRGIKGGLGDCFTYFTVAKALLTRVGIDNMDIERMGGESRHYWSLVNCGDGWYHFDSSPTLYGFDSFMMTDKQTEEYTAKRGKSYYVFDRSLYPATPEK